MWDVITGTALHMTLCGVVVRAARSLCIIYVLLIPPFRVLQGGSLASIARATSSCEQPCPPRRRPSLPCAPRKRVTHPSRGHSLPGDEPGMLRVPSVLREDLLVEGRAAVRLTSDALPHKPTSAEGNQSRCEKFGCYAFDQFDDAACPVCRTAL